MDTIGKDWFAFMSSWDKFSSCTSYSLEEALAVINGVSLGHLFSTPLSISLVEFQEDISIPLSHLESMFVKQSGRKTLSSWL